jgi:hypothetical protein
VAERLSQIAGFGVETVPSGTCASKVGNSFGGIACSLPRAFRRIKDPAAEIQPFPWKKWEYNTQGSQVITDLSTN